MAVKLNAKFWVVPPSDKFEFPEVADADLAYEPIKDRPNTGIAFSGGGTVSAALAPGFLKALEDLGVLKNVKYISGVSGGTWGTAAYCYALNAESRNKYFGLIKDPSELDAKTLETVPAEGTMAYAVTHAKITDLTLEYALYGHKAYTKAIGKIFLTPFGLDDSKKYFTTDKKTLANILQRNTHLSADDFLLLFSDENNPGLSSPYYIMNGTILTPPLSVKHEDDYTVYPFEFTPLYCGSKGHEGKDSTDEYIGGYFVESFAFNTSKPKENDDHQSVTVDEAISRLILSSPVGTSGSAVSEKIAESKHKGLTTFLPAFKYWNPNNTDFGKTQKYLFGDGGLAENTGISALLARNVENIVLFITEPFDLHPISDRPCEEGQRVFGYNQIAKLFGVKPIYDLLKDYDGKEVVTPIYEYDDDQQFFYEADFEGLKKELEALKKKGEPIIVTQTYTVKENKRFGIEGGPSVNVTWVVVDTCTGFNNSLPANVYDKSSRKFLLDGLDNFPAICTFKQNKEKHFPHLAYMIQLTSAQAYLLTNQAYWMARNSEKIKAALAG